MFRLKDKVVFVSGGAAGIGRAIVERFVSEGAVVHFGDVDGMNGEIVARSTGAQFVGQDVSQEMDWIAAMHAVMSREGRLDVLVNNAGILGTTAATECLDREQWERLFAVNVTGVMLGCKHAAKAMLAAGSAGGSIINLSSTAGILASANVGYSASKGAVRLLTKSVALDFARRGIAIRCNSIHPGAIDTPIFDPFRVGATIDPVVLQALERMTPMGRLGTPQEVASLAVFLASDEASFCTGSEFVADGGAIAGLAATSRVKS